MSTAWDVGDFDQAQGRMRREPVPPSSQQGQAGHHWLSVIDKDGRACALVVVQWQPQARRWCHSGDVDANRHLDTGGWRYHSMCPTPKL